MNEPYNYDQDEDDPEGIRSLLMIKSSYLRNNFIKKKSRITLK